MLPSASPSAGAPGWGGWAYIRTVACCNPFAVLTRSLIWSMPVARNELTLDAIRAKRARMPGRGTVATQDTSPNSRWRNWTSSECSGRRLEAESSGEVARGFRFQDSVTEKSFSWGGSAPTRTKDFSGAFIVPKRCSENALGVDGSSGPPRLSIPSV